MKIKIFITRSGVDAGSVYDVTGSYEGFLRFYDEFGRPNCIHTRYEGKLYQVVG